MKHSSALPSSPAPARLLTPAAHARTTPEVVRPPFNAPEWTTDGDTIMARWCVSALDADGGPSITTLVTTASGSFLTSADVITENPLSALQGTDELTALPFTPQHAQLVNATAHQRADLALADVRHAVTSGDPRMLTFFAADAARSTPAPAIAAQYICDALWERARTLQQTVAPAAQQEALRDAAVQLRGQAAQTHVAQALGEVEDEIHTRVLTVVSTLRAQAVQARDYETTAAYVAAAELVLQPAAPAMTAASSVIISARTFIDMVQRLGSDEVADDAATSSVNIQAGLIHALDDVRGSVAEVFSELHRALGDDLDVSALDDVITSLHAAGEDVPTFLDEIDPERVHLIPEL